MVFSVLTSEVTQVLVASWAIKATQVKEEMQVIGFTYVFDATQAIKDTKTIETLQVIEGLQVLEATW